MTNGPSQEVTPPLAPPDRTALLIAEYEFARDNRSNADATAWEMTAIVWGAQTLLLGFVLEAISNRDAQPLITGVGVLGLLLSVFNYIAMYARNKVCNTMIQICLRIEDRPEMEFKPQHFLNERYQRGIQSWSFYVMNAIFFLAWLAVIVWTAWLYCHNSSQSAHTMSRWL